MAPGTLLLLLAPPAATAPPSFAVPAVLRPFLRQRATLERETEAVPAGRGAPAASWSPVTGYADEPCQVAAATPQDMVQFGQQDITGIPWRVAFARPVPFGRSYRAAWADPDSGTTRYLVGLGPCRNNQGLTWVAFALERPD